MIQAPQKKAGGDKNDPDIKWQKREKSWNGRLLTDDERFLTDSKQQGRPDIIVVKGGRQQQETSALNGETD